MRLMGVNSEDIFLLEILSTNLKTFIIEVLIFFRNKCKIDWNFKQIDKYLDLHYTWKMIVFYDIQWSLHKYTSMNINQT